MSLIRLETKGRKTGLPHLVELRYAFEGGSFFVFAGSGRSDWVLNALGSGKVTVRMGDVLYPTSVQVASEAERETAFESFRRRYGRRFSASWYRDAEVCLRLSPSGPPARRGRNGGEFDTKTTFADWSKVGRDYYSDVALAFDSASEEYDFTISRNFINTWIRRRSIAVLSEYLRPDDTALEIGCGTGAEAVVISKRVRRLIATDVSHRMVELVGAKVRAKGQEDKIIPLRLAASEVSTLKEFAPQGIRVAYSFNGALNCEPRLGEFAGKLHDALPPGGIFVCSVRNTLCLSEAVSHAAVLQFDRMNPRKHQPIMVSVGGREIPSTYYPPSRFESFFKPYFKTKRTIALPAFLPPAYLSDYYLKLRSVTSIVERADKALSGRFPFNQFGDQTLFVFERDGPGGGRSG